MTRETEQRGEALLGRVEWVGRGVWAVPSGSQAGELHIVSGHRLASGAVDLLCDCRAAEFGRDCSHLHAVRLWAVRRRRQQRLTGPEETAEATRGAA